MRDTGIAQGKLIGVVKGVTIIVRQVHAHHELIITGTWAKTSRLNEVGLARRHVKLPLAVQQSGRSIVIVGDQLASNTESREKTIEVGAGSSLLSDPHSAILRGPYNEHIG